MSDHIGKGAESRKGWFAKDGNTPIPSYRKECRDNKLGFTGARHEVHHILPQTCIQESVAESGADAAYLAEVQFITDWNINGKGNLIGLPHYHAYALFYQDEARLKVAGGSDRAAELARWFNTWSPGSRMAWLRDLRKNPPKDLPVHNPVAWGHLEYNDRVLEDLIANVWSPLKGKKREHELDATSVAAELDKLASRYKKQLESRGATSSALWNRRLDPDDDGWHAPFTMTDVDNPLYG